MARKLNIFFVFLLVACSSTNSTIVEVEPTSTLIIENSTTTSTNVPPMALDSVNTSTTTTTLPLFTLDENCDENYPKYSKQRRACWGFKTTEMWEKCENPLSEGCFLEYNPTEVSYWEMGFPFWAEQYGAIYNWSNYYAYWHNLDWPQELVDIVNSPAFSIRDNGEEYDCFVEPASSMYPWLVGAIGIYPKPIEFSDIGPEFLGTSMWWTCNHRGEGNTYNIGGAPILRGDFGNINPDMRYARWTAYGYSDESYPYAKEFEISNFYWWPEDGWSIEKFCDGGLENFTYEEDYTKHCFEHTESLRYVDNQWCIIWKNKNLTCFNTRKEGEEDLLGRWRMDRYRQGWESQLVTYPKLTEQEINKSLLLYDYETETYDTEITVTINGKEYTCGEKESGMSIWAFANELHPLAGVHPNYGEYLEYRISVEYSCSGENEFQSLSLKDEGFFIYGPIFYEDNQWWGFVRYDEEYYEKHDLTVEYLHAFMTRFVKRVPLGETSIDLEISK